MSFDEKLFGWFWSRILKKVNSEDREEPDLQLEHIQTQSEILISALCEAKIEIRPSVRWGGFQGPLLFLPEKYGFLRTKNLQLIYLEWRLLTSSLEWQWGKIDSTPEGLETIFLQFQKLRKSYQILYPELVGLSQEVWFGESRIEKSKLKKQEDENLLNPLQFPSQKDANSKGTEIQGRTEDKAQNIQIVESENPLTHVFEKVMTAENYQSGSRRMDGSDQIMEHNQALSELTLSKVIRTNQSSQSVLKSHSIIEVSDFQIEENQERDLEKIYSYSEWFESKNIYRANWCKVYESKMKESEEQKSFNKKTANELRARLESCFSSYQWKSRQKEGEELDMTQVVDRSVQCIRGGTIIDNIYLKRQKFNHDFAIQILVDSSLSTDSYAHGKRIIETIQEALNIFVAAFSDILDSISISSFSSHTRNRIQYKVIKSFEENWDLVPLRISNLNPNGYTRIGPALRHSKMKLENINARKKLLILLSDAKPTDYDYYEGRHGLIDVRKAVLELNSIGCAVKALTVTDKKFKHHSQIFGSHNSILLKDVKELSESLFHFWYEAVR